MRSRSCGARGPRHSGEDSRPRSGGTCPSLASTGVCTRRSSVASRRSRAVTKRKIKAGNEDVEQDLTVEKAIYSRLFDHIILRINQALAAGGTNPFDVAKTRQQVAEAPLTTRGKGTLSLLASIARHEGWGARGAGLVPRLIKGAPSCAVMISSYELGKRFFAQRMEPSSSQD